MPSTWTSSNLKVLNFLAHRDGPMLGEMADGALIFS